MPTPTAKTETAPVAMQPAFDASTAEEIDDDPTTLKVTGPIRVTDEDEGGDPYNHTGKFRRAIR